MPERRVRTITESSFARYGVLIRMPPEGDTDKSRSNFAIVLPVKSQGWYLGYLMCRNKEVTGLHCHPESKETFEPVRGVPLLVVASPGAPNEYEVFLLDRPVCLFEGVWHAEMTLSDEAEIKIIENYSQPIVSKDYALAKPIRIGALS